MYVVLNGIIRRTWHEDTEDPFQRQLLFSSYRMVPEPAYCCPIEDNSINYPSMHATEHSAIHLKVTGNLSSFLGACSILAFSRFM